MRRIVLMLCFVLAVAAAWAGYWHVSGVRERVADAKATPTQRAEKAVPVVLAAVKRMTLPVSFATIGTVQPIASIAVTSQVSGMVSKLSVTDGADVKEGDILIELDTRLIDTQIEEAQAALVKDQANIDKAGRDLARIDKLLAGKFETPENAADAQTTIDLDKAALQTDQAMLHNLEVQREYYTIRAPVSGRIGTVPVRPGSTIVSGQQASPIVTINVFDPIYVTVGIPQKMVADLAEDKAQGLAKVSLTVPGRSEKREGAVTAIDNAANPATGLVTAYASIGNAPALLWPGEIVNVDVIFRDQPDQLTVPDEAVRTNQQGSYVYAVDAHQRAHLKPVVVARNVEGLTVIGSGLEDGDQVVTDGQLLLSDGALVQVKQAMKGG
ncbi:efflux RND transporter periplasmic adaptor subunit [Nordella sp. HKS 07]|uniref:efflux RND transporter periplasmic adaptor subunit n=1 Tax=Nordella sp. HKS 07 TaxID=2712222 RepID=UPI0013E16802|nr:efflux RND transporter periplasmic adaptor subunit [Nordella sp. HKS 07]QIG46450.1 efflux RND transporter periplasmic adaptor subunit [Nordella sp. HKS 07]